MAIRTTALAAAFLFAWMPPAAPWGFTGHEITGTIAQRLLSPSASEAVRAILPPHNNGSLSQIASWADLVKRRREYRFSAPLHYVNPKGDFPPDVCSFVDGNSDCPDERCVVGAIRNYTKILQTGRLSKDREEALKFLVHFIGDIHQPLHVTGRHRGGNGDRAIWESHHSNLHRVWDTSMIVKRIREDFGGSQDAYVEFILRGIDTTWAERSPAWVNCHSSPGCVQEECAICPDEWAGESDKMNCNVTYTGYSEDEDLSREYYFGLKAMDYPDILLAKAGVRISHALNVLLRDGPPQAPVEPGRYPRTAWSLIRSLKRVVFNLASGGLGGPFANFPYLFGIF